MLDSKLIITLISMIVAVFAVYNSSMGNSISENYWGTPGFKTRADPQVLNPITKQLQSAHPHHTEKDHFVSYPSFQSSLSPRFSNVNYGSNINYRLPEHKNLASPRTPLSTHDMNFNDANNIKENYSSQCGGFKNGTPLDETYAHKNIKKQDNNLPKPNLPPGIEQGINFNRLIFANKKSRQQGQACAIRGDVAIAPLTTSWFKSSYGPSDLRTGAMQVMGGIGNSTANELADLKFKYSGGVDTVSGGVNLSNQFSTQLGGDSTTIVASTFP